MTPEEIKEHFERELVSVTLNQFLRLGEQLDPFSNWVLAGAGAVLFFVMDKFGKADGPFGRGLAIVIVILLVISIGAGFLARFLSMQGLVMANQWRAYPAEIERVHAEYRSAAPPHPTPLDGKRVNAHIQTVLRTEGDGPPGLILGLVWRMTQWLVNHLSGSEQRDITKVDEEWRGMAIAAHGVEQTLPLIVAQMFFLTAAIALSIVGLIWPEVAWIWGRWRF